MSLRLVPVSRTMAKDCVTRWHRHNDAPPGDLFRVGICDDSGTIVCVGIAGRPIARHYDDGDTVEIVRVSSDGTKNATSMAYAALTRAAFALGYRRVITYTQAGESGASLRAAGWRVIAERPARKGWDTPSRPRDDAKLDRVRALMGELPDVEDDDAIVAARLRAGRRDRGEEGERGAAREARRGAGEEQRGEERGAGHAPIEASPPSVTR